VKKVIEINPYLLRNNGRRCWCVSCTLYNVESGTLIPCTANCQYWETYLEQADADAVEEELDNPPSETNMADEPATFSDDTSADEAFEIVDRISEDD
jgi:hypothetical protein